MAGFNRAIVQGNIGGEPEVRTFADGRRVASFSVATSEVWKDKANGERRERTEWHRVSVLAEQSVGIVERYLHKGDPVLVEGQLQTRKWQGQDGSDRYTTEIVVRPYGGGVTLLRGGSPASDGPRGDSDAPPATDRRAPAAAALDDEIPF